MKKKNDIGTFDPTQMHTRHERVGNHNVEVSEKGRIISGDASRYQRSETGQNVPSDPLSGTVHANDAPETIKHKSWSEK